MIFLTLKECVLFIQSSVCTGRTGIGLSTARHGTKPCLSPCLLCIPVCLYLQLMYISKLSCWSFPSVLFWTCVGQKTLAGHWEAADTPVNWHQCGLRDDVPEKRGNRLWYFVTCQMCQMFYLLYHSWYGMGRLGKRKPWTWYRRTE